jgi:hypothetical protein
MAFAGALRIARYEQNVWRRIVGLLDPIDRARLEKIRLRLIVDVARAEVAQRGHLLVLSFLFGMRFRRRSLQELRLACLALALRRRLGFDRRP